MKNPFAFALAFAFLFISVDRAYSQLVQTDLLANGISQERLKRYDAFLEKEVKTGKIPGAVSLISRNGVVVHKVAYGFSSLADQKPMQEDNIFHIMSMTKPIVSVAFMMLYEEGYFQLDDPVSKYLPQFKNLKVAKDVNAPDGETEEPNKEVTIHQLLTHTAGFSHGLGDSELDKAVSKALYFQHQESIETRVDTLVSLPLVNQPGEQWYYSASPDVLSLLIEHFSGMTAAEFLQKRIFDPLEMNDTGYNIAKENQDRWVPVHNYDKDGKMANSEQQLPVEGNTVYGGTHGLFSTAGDYMKFCQMLLNKGKASGKQLLSSKTIDIMTINQIGDLSLGPGDGFGLGFGVITDLAGTKALGSVGQYYWGGAYSTFFFVDPQEELIAVLMTQVQPYSNYYGTIMRQFVYQTIVD
ncbi:MAG: serine hydrolase domain-containing protein [Aurantibacter sp.]